MKNDLKTSAQKLIDNNQLVAAEKLYEEACSSNKKDSDAWFELGKLQARMGKHQKAIGQCKRALSLEPKHARALCVLGDSLQALGNPKEAQSCYQQALQLQPDLAGAHFQLGNLLRNQSIFDPAEQSYHNAVRYDPNHALAHYYRGNMLKLQSKTEEAIESYNRALKIAPGLSEAYWNKLRALPVTYDDQNQIDYYRNKYADNLKQLCRDIRLDTPQARTTAFKGLVANTNFFLQYQGLNDLELQQQYGELLVRVVTARYPQWSAAREMPPINPNERIRIGYASAFLRNHNGAVWLLGWLRHRDRNKFEIFCYHTDTKIDDKSSEMKAQSDHFHHLPNNMERVCTQITSDKLHLLVYPELGMKGITMAMAGLRLAPIQCVGWGHPITSGLSTMDYWISSDLMEPVEAQKHYSEELVRLPNMGHCYATKQRDRLNTEPIQKTRADFKLRDDAVLYLCSQSLFKYLPEYDYLVAEIARQVPNAQFVFLAISSVHVVRRFMQRIDKAFQSVGLDAMKYCMMLNRLSEEDYLTLNRLADVFLDNPPWSGNNTTLAAIDCNLPVVTWPTEMMRGRHSYAILKMMGMDDTIAGSSQEYIDIAARLGNDKAWRNKIATQTTKQRTRIYEDTTCVEALESFYLEAINKKIEETD